MLTIFPITVPIQAMVKLGISELPAWQIITRISVLIISIIGILFLAIKVFRVYILMYGKRPKLKDIGRNLKTS